MTPFEEYLNRYLDLIPSENWLEEMKSVTKQTLELYQSFSEDKGNFAYAEGKWSLKMLLEHLIDTEKIFTYRALCFVRKDTTELPGFDEELYAQNGTAHCRTLPDLIEEFRLNRQLSYLFFSKLNVDQLVCEGKANGNVFSVETIGKWIVAHNIHHTQIVKERYLPKMQM